MAGKAPEIYRESVFLWWVENHGDILTLLLTGEVPLRAKVYGGFALAIQLPREGAAATIKENYQAGTALVEGKHKASDIDMKLYGFPPLEPKTILKGKLLAMESPAPVLKKQSICVPPLYSTIERINKRNTKNFVELQIPGGIPFPGVLAIVAYLFNYENPRPIPGEMGVQIIIKAVYKNGTCQTLSEITCFQNEIDLKEPLFQAIPISELCDQFIIQLSAMIGRHAAYSKSKFSKVFDRIITCLNYLIENKIKLNEAQRAFWEGRATTLEEIQRVAALLPPEVGAELPGEPETNMGNVNNFKLYYPESSGVVVKTYEQLMAERDARQQRPNIARFAQAAAAAKKAAAEQAAAAVVGNGQSASKKSLSATAREFKPGGPFGGGRRKD